MTNSVGENAVLKKSPHNFRSLSCRMDQILKIIIITREGLSSEVIVYQDHYCYVKHSSS